MSRSHQNRSRRLFKGDAPTKTVARDSEIAHVDMLDGLEEAIEPVYPDDGYGYDYVLDCICPWGECSCWGPMPDTARLRVPLIEIAKVAA